MKKQNNEKMKELFTLLEKCEKHGDIDFYVEEYEGEKSIDIFVNDFEGFNKNWDEVYNEELDGVVVSDIEKFLKKNASKVVEGYRSIWVRFCDYSINMEWKSANV